MNIVEKMKSQIGDDPQHIFDHEALFKLAVAEIERLRAVLLDIDDNPCCDECCGGAALRASVALMEDT